MFAYSQFIHDYSLSTFPYDEPISPHYTVTVNGTAVPVYTCRISKYPLNRVWTGFQRPGNQTEVASFVNLTSDEPLDFVVTTTLPHEKILLKPYSKGIVPTETAGEIRFTLPENGQFVLEADSYHHCLYIFNSKPIEAPDPAEVTHYFGPGVHFPGKITLHSHESLYVDRDALVFGGVYAENAEDIRVFGNGLLDDMSEGRCYIHCYEAFTNGNLKFYDCKNVRIEGVLCRDSAIWCVNLFHCFDVTLDNIKVFGQWRYNTDGVDIVNCQDIRIQNSFIHSFDDTITIKGIDRYAETNNERITTENCVLWCDWGKTCEVGIETYCRRYKDITFRNCDLLRAGNTALDIQNGEEAEVMDVLYEDIRVEYNSFDTDAQYQDTDDTVYTRQNTIQIPMLLSISNHIWRTQHNEDLWGVPCKHPVTIDLTGVEQGCVHNVVCRNIKVYYDEKIPLTGDGKYNVPINVQSHRAGVVYRHILVENVEVNGVKLTPDNAVLWLNGVDGFVLR